MAERQVPGTREPRGPRASPCAPSAEPGSSREDGKLGPEGPWPASSPQGGWAPLGTDRSRHSGSTAKRTRKGKRGVMRTRRLPQCWAGHGESRLQRRSNNSQKCKRWGGVTACPPCGALGTSLSPAPSPCDGW